MKKIISEIKSDSSVLNAGKKYNEIISDLSFSDNEMLIRKIDYGVKRKFNELTNSLVKHGKIIDGYISSDIIDGLEFTEDVKKLYVQYLNVIQRVIVDTKYDLSNKFYNDGTNSLKTYFEEMDEYPLLTAEEEQKLGKDISEGVDGAYETLVNSNLRLVVSIAKSYIGNSLPFQDLIQAGNLGLMRAAEKYDYSLGYRFTTYATWWIKQSISRAITNEGSIIRMPVYVESSVRKYKRYISEFEKNNGRLPNESEIIAGLNVSCEKLHTIKSYFSRSNIVSLETPIGEDEDSYLKDFLADEDSFTPEENILNIDMENVVSKLLDCLSEREKKIIKLRFGFDGKSVKTLENIAAEFGLTRERVRQIEAVALQKLRIISANEQYEAYRTFSFGGSSSMQMGNSLLTSNKI